MSALNYNLADQVFVVTGGSRGIGFEIAKLLLDQKARVVICGRKQEGLDLAAQELGARTISPTEEGEGGSDG